MTTNTTPEWHVLLAQMVEVCGLNTEVCTSAKEIADTLSASHSAVGRLRTFAERVGGLKTRYVPNGGKQGGRDAFYTFTHDADWMLAEGKRLWGITELNWATLDTQMPKYAAGFQPFKKENGGTPTRKANPEVITEKSEETQLTQQLRPARKNDVEALIEASRQYAGREAFITEELKRFAEMGITIDASAIKVEKDPVMEQVAVVVEFIDKLKRTIDRQADTIKTLQDQHGSTDKVKSLEEQLRLALQANSELRRQSSDVQAAHREQMQRKDQRIQKLEGELKGLATVRLQSIGAS